MEGLILIIVLIAAFFVIRAFWRQKQEQQLRDNPPQRRIVEISLPGGINDARTQMPKFWRKMASATTVDPKARKQGIGQIDFMYLVTVPEPKSMPRLTCLVYSDPDKMDAVKRALKQTFEDIDIIEHEEDPMLPVAAALRPVDESKEPENE